MPNCDELLTNARNNPKGVRFVDACALATCFGWVFARSRGSHHIYKRPAQMKVMVFQDANGMAKDYQVRQLLRAIDESSEEAR